MKTKKHLNMVRVALTPYCDLRCEHCYAADISMNQMIGLEKDQLSLEEIKNFLLQLIRKQKLNKIVITGGEVLTDRVWTRTKELLKFALERDLMVQINTSGSDTVTVKDIYEVAGVAFKNITFHISLDHVNEEWVNRFRGKDNAYRRAIQMISDVVKYRGYSEVRFTITSDNYDAAKDCYQLASNIGADCFVAKVVFPSGGVYNHEYLKMNEDVVADVQRGLIRESVNNKTALMLPCPVFCERTNLPDHANCLINQCTCGDTSVYLSYNGDVLPCTYIQGSEYCDDVKIGNVRDKDFDFDKAWDSDDSFKAYRAAGEFECTTYKILNGEIKAE